MILLTEGKFLTDLDRNLKFFRKLLLKKVGDRLNRGENKHQNGNGTLWRQIGDSYLILYFPQYSKDIIYGKVNAGCLQLFIIQGFELLFRHRHCQSDPQQRLSSATHTHTHTHFRELLLTFLELGESLDCTRVRLYFERNEEDCLLRDGSSTATDYFTDFKVILKNLNWIGGRMVRNEDRGDDTLLDKLEYGDLLLSDERFLILEFEC